MLVDFCSMSLMIFSIYFITVFRLALCSFMCLQSVPFLVRLNGWRITVAHFSHSWAAWTILSTMTHPKTLNGRFWIASSLGLILSPRYVWYGDRDCCTHSAAPNWRYTLNTSNYYWYSDWMRRNGKQLPYRVGDPFWDSHSSFLFGAWRANNTVIKEQNPCHWLESVRGMKTFQKKATAGKISYSVQELYKAKIIKTFIFQRII